MFSLVITFTQRPSIEEWENISASLFNSGARGIDEGIEPAPEGEAALIAGDEFAEAIHPGALSTPIEAIAYFESAEECESAWQGITPLLTTTSATRSIAESEDKDYSESWKLGFQPMFCSPFWLIRASWHSPEQITEVESKLAAAERATLKEIIIEPGMAFGTGTHETTQTCLTLMASAMNEVQTRAALAKVSGKSSRTRVLDFGCGSGILAIAAKRLGADEAIGVDIDPLALDATIENARRNKVNVVVSGEVPTDHEGYDLIVANILKNTLLDFASRFHRWLKPGGYLVLSGLLNEQADDIKRFYHDQGFDVVQEITKKEWTSLKLKSHPMEYA